MVSVFDVANYIVNKLGSVTTMKLQKLCYYCQAWSLAWDDEPLFDEEFQAWANGPVCYELFAAYKGLFRVDKDNFKKLNVDIFSKEQIETMDAVIRDLGDKPPHWLSDLTHSEQPWLDARKGCEMGEPSNNVISKISMQDYYAGLSKNRRKTPLL